MASAVVAAHDWREMWARTKDRPQAPGKGPRAGLSVVEDGESSDTARSVASRGLGKSGYSSRQPARESIEESDFNYEADGGLLAWKQKARGMAGFRVGYGDSVRRKAATNDIGQR